MQRGMPPQKRDDLLGELKETRIAYVPFAKFGMGVMLSGPGTEDLLATCQKGMEHYRGRYLSEPDVMVIDEGRGSELMPAGASEEETASILAQYGIGFIQLAKMKGPDHIFIGKIRNAYLEEENAKEGATG